MPNINLGAEINRYVGLFIFFVIFVLVILVFAYVISPLVISIKAYVNNEPNELFPSDESKVRTYYRQYFSDSETPFYLVEAIWSELLAYLNDYYFAVPYSYSRVPSFSENYFINNPDVEFDFSSHKEYGKTFWKKLIAKLNINVSVLEEYKGNYTFIELVEYLKPKLKPPLRVLVVSNTDAHYSVFAEALINYLGKGRFSAFSAGSPPIGKLNPAALAVLESNGLSMDDYKSQSSTEFADEYFDIVISVGDSTTKETYFGYLDNSTRVHWDLANPALVSGSDVDIEKAFQATYKALSARIKQMVTMPIESMTPKEISRALDNIGNNL